MGYLVFPLVVPDDEVLTYGRYFNPAFRRSGGFGDRKCPRSDRDGELDISISGEAAGDECAGHLAAVTLLQWPSHTALVDQTMQNESVRCTGLKRAHARWRRTRLCLSRTRL